MVGFSPCDGETFTAFGPKQRHGMCADVLHYYPDGGREIALPD
jgi:hypothetical protein